MKIFYYLVFLVLLPLQTLAENGSICSSNVMFVDDRYYTIDFDFDNQVAFETLPFWLPGFATDLFSKAQKLPVDAGEDLINTLVGDEPGKISVITPFLKQYEWHGQEQGVSYLFLVRTYKDCIENIHLMLQGLPGDKANNTYYFTQKNAVPIGSKTMLTREGGNICKIKEVTDQKFEFTRDGQVIANKAGDIPEYATMLFFLFDSFNYRREKIYAKIGKGQRREGAMTWNLVDESGTSFQVELSLFNNCEKVFRISWQDSEGRQFVLLRENYYD